MASRSALVKPPNSAPIVPSRPKFFLSPSSPFHSKDGWEERIRTVPFPSANPPSSPTVFGRVSVGCDQDFAHQGVSEDAKMNFVLVARQTDGLALSASTDIVQDPSMFEAQRITKLISRKSAVLADRCIYETQQFKVLMQSGRGVTVMVVCSPSMSTPIAFDFLEVLLNDFVTQFDANEIATVRRAYALIEFDSTIQRMRQRYSNVALLSTQRSLADVNADFQLRPPYQLTSSDLGLVYIPNGFTSLTMPSLTSNNPPMGPSASLATPVSSPFSSSSSPSSSSSVQSPLRKWRYVSDVDRLLLLITVFWAVFGGSMKAYRSFILLFSAHIEDETEHASAFGVVFVFDAVCQFLQVFYLLKMRLFRALIFSILAAICTLTTMEFYSGWLAVFHVMPVLLSAGLLFRVRLRHRLRLANHRSV